MGGSVSNVVEKTKKAIGWLTDPSVSSKHGSDYEYDVEEPEPEIRRFQAPDEHECEPETYSDPRLEANTPQHREHMEAVKGVFQRYAHPSFSIVMDLDKRAQFSEFLNWINETSGCQYIVTEKETRELQVIQLKRPSNAPSVSEQGYQLNTPGNKDYEESIMESVAASSNPSDYSHTQSTQLTSSMMSIITQLRNGVIIKSRNNPARRTIC